MITFTYTAMNANGTEQKGKLQAESEQAAAMALKQRGLFPTALHGGTSGREKKGAAPTFRLRDLRGLSIGGAGIKGRELTAFTRRLATLLSAGLPLVRALRTLQRQARRNPLQANVLGSLAESVEGGSTFSEALAGHPKSFSSFYVNMVRAGEASGSLESVLQRLARFMEKAARVRAKVKAAMVYPSIVMVVAMAITAGLMVFVVPRFATIFDEMLPGLQLPALTRMVLLVSETLKDHALVLVTVLAISALAFKGLRKTRFGAYAFDLVAVRLPPVNQLVVKTIIARFCRTLGTLMQSGVAVLQGLQIARDTAGNAVAVNAIQSVHDAVKEGESMTRPLQYSAIFPEMAVSMMEVGEETGALPEMLNRVADVYEEEVDQTIDSLTSLIEPGMIVMLAIVVGTIVIALFLPLIEIIRRL